ncbi:hypothetical protein BOX15_Mlig016031g2, partial [Macrostomum lignano]
GLSTVAMVMDNRPCHTIYVNNLNDRVKKSDLKAGLYYLFNQFGKVVDLVAMKTPSMRGQAFIGYKDISHATVAVRSLQGFLLFDKPMRLQFAKRDSTVVKRLKGGTALDKKSAGKAAAAAASAAAAGSQDEADKRKKKITIRMMTDAESAAAAASAAAASSEAEEPMEEQEGEANNVLLLNNLPDETTAEMLQMLFSQVDGLKEARCIDGRPDVAFIEYETEEQAKSAMDIYQGFKIDHEHAMRISFAKK